MYQHINLVLFYVISYFFRGSLWMWKSGFGITPEILQKQISEKEKRFVP